MFGYLNLLSNLDFNIKEKVPFVGSEDEDDDEPEYNPDPDYEVVFKKLEIAQTIFDDLETAFEEHKIPVDERDEIIQQQETILELAVEISGNQYEIKYYKAENNPTMNEMAEVMGDVKTLFQGDYVVDERVESVVERLRDEAKHLLDLIESKPEFKYAYSETERRTQYTHEIQSLGIPDEVNPKELDHGEDGEEIFAGGRGIRMLEEVCQNPNSPLWLGIGTRNGRDVSVDKRRAVQASCYLRSDRVRQIHTANERRQAADRVGRGDVLYRPQG